MLGPADKLAGPRTTCDVRMMLLKVPLVASAELWGPWTSVNENLEFELCHCTLQSQCDVGWMTEPSTVFPPHYNVTESGCKRENRGSVSSIVFPEEVLEQELPKRPSFTKPGGVALKALQGHFVADILVFNDESTVELALRQPY